MDKKVIAVLRLQLFGGSATPAPPVGPSLGQHEVNISRFCMEFNERTREQQGAKLPVVVTVYNDRSFGFVVKQPNTAYLLKEAAGISKGSGQPSRDVAGSITRDQLRRIAETKMPDLNTPNLEAAERIIAGTARSMGIEVIS